MVREGACFLRDNALGRLTLSGSGRNGRRAGRKFKQEGKMYRGIEKDTKTVK
jgi:hypothetical protein